MKAQKTQSEIQVDPDQLIDLICRGQDLPKTAVGTFVKEIMGPKGAISLEQLRSQAALALLDHMLREKPE